MAQTNATPLDNLTLSVFCEQFAMMLGAGIGADEAAGLLAEDTEKNTLHDAATAVQRALLEGATLTDAVAGCGYFPPYMQRMLATGETAGRTEEVLRSLAAYYEGQAALQQRLRSAVVYPLILLALMAGVLAVLLAGVLPVFSGVYENLAGGMAAASYRYIHAAYLVGWVAFAVTAAAALAVLACVVAARSPAGRARLLALAARCPVTAGAAAQLALARFTRVLSIFIASGADPDTAMEAAEPLAEHPAVAAKVAACRTQMQEGGAGLATAIYTQKLFEPLYGRMLIAGARSGNLEGVLARLADLFTADADARTDALVDAIEPALSGFLTVAVGVTLVAAMLPLLGMLGAIA